MNSKTQIIDIQGLTVELQRKPIKNLNIGIYPPQGRVRVSAPLRYSDHQIFSAVANRAEWIREQQLKFRSRTYPPERKTLSGEMHFFLGCEYPLQVVEHSSPQTHVFKTETAIELHTTKRSSQKKREAGLNQWYRNQLHSLLPALFEKWSHVLNVEVNAWEVKRMKTRWGTCNPRTKQIWIGLDLAKHPHECIEYVVVHELAHLLEASHNARFKSIMTAALPHWKELQKQLKNPR